MCSKLIADQRDCMITRASVILNKALQIFAEEDPSCFGEGSKYPPQIEGLYRSIQLWIVPVGICTRRLTSDIKDISAVFETRENERIFLALH